MLRRRFGSILTAVVLASGMLLSSCASKKSTQDPMASEYFDVKVKPETNDTGEFITNGAKPVPKDLFYDTQVIDLPVPDKSAEIGLPLIYSYTDAPYMTQDYILIPYSQVYSKKADIFDVISSDVAYGDPQPDVFIEMWAIYDMNGRYLGSMMDQDYEWVSAPAVDFLFGIKFDQDKSGNLVAVYSTYGETDGTSSYNMYMNRYSPNGDLLTAPILLLDYVDNKPKGMCVTEDDLIVVATSNELICFTMEGQPLSYCNFSYDMVCIDMWEQNGKVYVQLLPGVDTGDMFDAPYHFYEDENEAREDCRILSFTVGASGVLSVDGSCRNGEGLLAMRYFQGENGVYAATKNALGVMDMESGEFSTLLDWNQSNIDRKLLEMGTIQVLSEGERTQTLSVIPDESLSFPSMSMEVIDPDEVRTAENFEHDYDPDGSVLLESDAVAETNIADSENYLETNDTQEVTENDETGETTVLDSRNDPETSDSGVTRVAVASTVETDRGRDAKLVLLTPMDTNPHQGQPVIWIGGCHLVDSKLAQSVARYNADPSHPVWIKLHEYTDYYEDVIHVEDGEPDAWAFETMKTQIYSGNGPDIIYMTGTGTELDNASCLTDLNPYLDGKNGIDRDEYYDSVFRAFETKGKLYEVPLSFRVLSVAADVDRIGKIDNISTLDLLNCEGNLKSGETIYASFSPSLPLAWMASTEMGDWLDKDGGNVLVTKEALMNLMQLSKDQFQQLGASYFPFDTSDYTWIRREGAINSYSYGFGFLHLCEIGSVAEYMEGFAYRGNYAWIGVPGSRDNRSAVRSSMTVGIASYSTQKEQAWEVIRYFLSMEEQDQFSKIESSLYSYTANSFPVFRGSFYKTYLEGLNQEMSYDYSVPVDESDYTFVTVPVTADTEMEMDAFLSAPHRRFVYDEGAFQIIAQEANQFVLGTKTKEQAANDAITRLKAYVTG